MGFDLFGEQQYEKLDDLTQIIEPFLHPLNDVLDKLLNERVLTFDDIKDRLEQNTIAFDGIIDNMVDAQLRVLNIDYSLSWESKKKLRANFKILAEQDDPDYRPRILLDQKVIKGVTLMMRKKKMKFDENELLKLTQKEVEGDMYLGTSDINLSMARDVLELFGKECSSRKRFTVWDEVRKAINSTILENTWNIKNGEYFYKMAKWVKEAVSLGKTASYANFCQLKIMSHGGLPIYEMKEVK